MNRIQRVIGFYVLANKLKNVIRKGWLDWNVNAKRVESVAEHIYGVQMLALAMYSEYQYDIDIAKVMFMLAVHELEETVIGDLTYLDISAEEKKRIGHEAVEKILSSLLSGEQVKALIFEFDERQTKEAKFAYHCDKLECDLQCKLYDESCGVDLNKQGGRADKTPELIQKIQSGETTWSEFWLEGDKPKYSDDSNFMEVLEYAMNNPITKNDNNFIDEL